MPFSHQDKRSRRSLIFSNSLSAPNDAMFALSVSPGSFIHSVDPRLRILLATFFSLALASYRTVGTLLVFLAIFIMVLLLAIRPSLGSFMRKMVPVNVFCLLLILLMPLGTPGEKLFSIGPLPYGSSGLLAALLVTLRVNTIYIVCLSLLGSMDTVVFAHALAHLHVPRKLTYLLLFTVRYVDVIHDEYQRLSTAMRIRCFRPGMNLHTYRTYGTLAGQLILRSLNRAERVSWAMKCRCFAGEFYLPKHFHYHQRDVFIVLVSFALLTSTIAWEIAKCLTQ